MTASLHARARACVDAFACDLDALACDLARYQAERIPGYARLCRGVDLDALTRAEDIPAVPTDVFKLTRVATFPESETAITFRTSGTTIGQRGQHAMRDVSTYAHAATVFGRYWLMRDLQRAPIVVLGPPPTNMPDSSLTHMFACFERAFGEASWVVDDNGVFDLDTFDRRVTETTDPVLVLSTSFGLVHFLDAIEDNTFRLPPGSRVMHTGGFKGKSREVSPVELRKEVSRVFAIDERAIVMEYGMTELSSQFYEQTLFTTDIPHGIFAEPPWAKVIAVDPETLKPVPDGEVGIAKIIDTMNIDSAVAIQTQDQVRRAPHGFELLGRLPGAAPRGCSIAIDEMLSNT